MNEPASSSPLELDSATHPPASRAAHHAYRGIWKVLADVYKVPLEPPALPIAPGETLLTFRPASGFLGYLRIQLIIGLIVAGLLMLGGIGGISIGNFLMGVVGLPVAIAIEVASALVGFLVIYLRYDSTWYALSERSLRIRRGIWVIHETTITFENVQNVRVKQGPLQRWFGIANVVVDTAGGGVVFGESTGDGHRGKIEGIADAESIRDLILQRLERCRTSGLGDELASERVSSSPIAQGFTDRHIELLTEIRDLANRL